MDANLFILFASKNINGHLKCPKMTAIAGQLCGTIGTVETALDAEAHAMLHVSICLHVSTCN